jgi:hypothetical protein
MREAVQVASRLVAVGGWLGVVTTAAEQAVYAGELGERYEWSAAILLPFGETRILALGRRLR